MSEEDAQARPPKPAEGGRKPAALWRAIVEIGFIIFLFYSNLLMGEFARSRAGRGITLVAAIRDICTTTTFEIGLICALIGFVVVEYLRQKI